MKKFKTEFFAIVCSMAFAYIVQLAILFFCYLSNPKGNFITKDMFIPLPALQIAIVPLASWVLIGIWGAIGQPITWFDTWLVITMRALSILTPFIIIAGVTMIIDPTLWQKSVYWVVNAALSVFIAFTLLSPLLHFRCSDVGQDLPEDQ